MAQPTPYVPTTDFSEEEADGVAGRSTVRTAALDAEFANLQTTTDQIRSNLALIQRDDGALKDQIVTIASLSTEVSTLFTVTTIKGAWLTATAYVVGDVVSNGGGTYVCAIAHTSGVFAVDLAANKWVQIYGPATVVTLVDQNFSLTGSVDATKIAKFECDTNIATGTTRTFTFPDANGTLTLLERAQTFTADQTFQANVTIGDASGDALTVNATATFAATVNIGAQSLVFTDATIIRDAANTLGIRNASNAQALQLYKDYTNGANNEFLKASWSGHNLRLQLTGTGAGAGSLGTFQFLRDTVIGLEVTANASGGSNTYVQITGSNATSPKITVAGGANVSLLLDSVGSGQLKLNSVSGGDILWGKALVALGGGAAPTLGTIGGTGPAAAAQRGWIRLIESDGTPSFLPVWR